MKEKQLMVDRKPLSHFIFTWYWLTKNDY